MNFFQNFLLIAKDNESKDNSNDGDMVDINELVGPSLCETSEY